MAANTIVQRVFDFLKDFPPFSMLASEDLKRISESVEVKYFQDGEYIFRQKDEAGAFIYVVKDGEVDLLVDQEDGPSLLDVCDEGDVFGVRAMISQKPYVSSAKVKGEALVYAVPVKAFRPLLDQNNRVSLYFAAGLASGQTVLRNSLEAVEQGRKGLNDHDRQMTFFRMDDTFSVEGTRELITTSADETIQDVAQLMADRRIGSIIIVDEAQYPIGIVTDTDFRKKVATGRVGITAPVSAIMNSPVLTIAPNRSVAEVMIEMIRASIHHLCVTTDGTNQAKAIGIISDHDLLLSQSDNPAVIVREIQKSAHPQQLPALRDKAEALVRNYLQQDVSIRFVTDVITEINDALIVRAIRLAEEQMSKEGVTSPQLQFAWMSLGSEGRMEQLLRTDQDNALVYEEPAEGQEEVAKAYFLALARQVTQTLIECGFVKCPADMMASNPKWCMPISQWKKSFHGWIHSPTSDSIMMCTIFFDYRLAYGDQTLTQALTSYIYSQIDKSKMFLNFLAKNASQNPPPLSFFKNFIVEKGGEHKDNFDIKARAMMPLTDAARLLTMQAKLEDQHNTMRRFEKLAEQDQNHASLYREAAMAYGILLRIRALSGLANGHSGRYIQPEKLNKIERNILRNAFRPIEELQTLLRLRFRLDYFG